MTHSPRQIEDLLAQAIGARIGLAAADVDPDRPFADLGLDSQAAVELSGELEEKLGRSIDPTLVFECPTIRTLAARLGAGGSR